MRTTYSPGAKLRLLLPILTTLLLLPGGGHIVAGGLTRDLTVEQRPLAEFALPASDLKISTWLDRSDDTYKVGETVQLFVKTNQDAYVTVIDVGTSGKVHILFPNKYATDNRVLAHQPVQIPGPDAPYRIRVGGPAGHELIKVIATTRPDRVVSADQLSELGAFYAYRGTTASLTRDLGIELKEKHAGKSDVGAAVAEKVIRIKVDEGAAPPRADAGPRHSTAASAEDLYRLGETNFYGEGGERNGREALRYFTAAADAGHVGAMFAIGRIHETGMDVDQDPAAALAWYRKAAEKGNTQAMVRLAILSAKPGSPHRDLAATARWLKKAAGQGDGMAMMHLAKMHDEGLGVERLPREAARYLLSALRTGAWTVLAEAGRLSEETRHEVQAQLRLTGHYSGTLDGRIGPETRAAMVEWAKAGV